MDAEAAPAYGRRAIRSETGSVLSPFERESTDDAVSLAASEPPAPGPTQVAPDLLPTAHGESPAVDGQAFARVGPRNSTASSQNGSVVSSFVDAKGAILSEHVGISTKHRSQLFTLAVSVGVSA